MLDRSVEANFELASSESVLNGSSDGKLALRYVVQVVLTAPDHSISTSILGVVCRVEEFIANRCNEHPYLSSGNYLVMLKSI